MKKLPVTVLGATGLVGQRFVARLAAHPWFELVGLAASERHRGRLYGEVVDWRVPGPGLPEAAAGVVLCAAEPDHLGAVGARIAFSALASEVAREVEPAFARAGAWVFSNASTSRLEPDVPLLVPEVNPDHVALVGPQRELRGWSGALVCNPNCTTAVLALALAPLHAAFGVRRVRVTSLQAASGAGVAGLEDERVPSNVLPFIEGEEEKLAAETARLLGELAGEVVVPADFVLSAACHRVAVVDGHTLSVACELGGAPAPSDVRAALDQWRPPTAEHDLPSAPPRALRVHDAPDRPQPRLDVDVDGGMPVHIGRVRACPVLGVQFVALGHNLERGAAGASVLNAELLYARGVLS